MKRMKKIAALFLAVVMVLAMGMTAMAARGTVTVTDTVKDATYTLYKVFNATTNGNGGYNYTIPEDSNIDVTDAEFAAVFTTKNNGGETYVEVREDVSESAVTSYLQKNIDTIGIPVGDQVTSNGEDVTFTVTDDGYYYVASSVSNGAAAMVSTVTGIVTIREKNDLPGWGNGGKEADGETFFVGDTITYTLTYEKALNYANGTPITQYVVKDTPDTGIVIDESTVKVTVGGVEVDKATLSGSITDEGGMIISWVDAEGTPIHSAPTEIVVTYEAKITSEAADGREGNGNTASIGYNEEEPVTDDETVYMGSITINKFDGENEETLLEATFVISDSDLGTEGAKFLKYDAEGAQYSWVDSIEDATAYITENGKAEIKGLAADTYYLIETVAPEGYNLMERAKPVVIAVPADGAEEDTLVMTANVPNYAGAQLPSTGGIGTTIFYVIGGILVLGAGILLITKKRMSARD